MIANDDRTDVRNFPPVEENIERPDTLSQGLLAKHENCPRSAYLARKYKGGPGSIEMDRGVALHETLERCEKLMEESGEITIPGEVARDMAEAVMQERTDLVLPAAEQDRVRLMAWNWAESSYGTLDPETYLGTEIPLEMELGGFRLTCRVDRAEAKGSSLYVYDRKSGFPGSRESAEQSFQGRFYGMELLWGVNQDDPDLSYGAGIDEVWFYEYFPRVRNEETGELFTHESVWTRTELFEFKSAVERNVEAFAASLETGLWPARDGSWCGYCPAQGECPIPAHLREIELIETPEDAEIAFSHRLALKREGDRYQAALREWFKENGVVYLGDFAFDAKTSVSKSIDREALEQAVLAGEQIDLQAVTKERASTKYAERKLTKEERDARVD